MKSFSLTYCNKQLQQKGKDMLNIKVFVFNEVQENTIVLSDDTKECIIIDAGCNNEAEQLKLSNYIAENGLKPVMLLNTHGHFDHIMGNAYVYRKYGLLPLMHRGDLNKIESATLYVSAFGLQMEDPPTPKHFLEDGETLKFGNTEFKVMYTPGHSEGGVCFYFEKDGLLISGDTLFSGSIGRTDLPGGDYDELIQSIHTKLLILPEDTKVICGHGPGTTIGREARSNPFLTDDSRYL